MIDNIPVMGAVLSYCRAHHIPCWAIYIKPEWRDMPYPGVSVELVSMTHSEALIRSANGDQETVPAAHLHLRADRSA